MSGTSYGACVLHVAPEAYVGGPLALVRDGDMVALDVPGRSLNLLVPDAELAARKAAWQRRRRASSAAMACCTSSTSVRPIRAAISIFCRPKRALNPRANRRFINPGDGSQRACPKAASDGAGLPPRPGRSCRDGPAKSTQGGDIHGTQCNAGAPAPGAGRADRGGGRGDARRAVRADGAMADAARQAGGAVPARRQHRRDRQAAGGRTGQDLGQTVIVENKGGANGNIGSDAVAKAEPDGYTLLLSGVGSNAINYALYASMPYRDSDFAHVSLLATGPNVLVAAPDFRQDLRGLHPAGAREPGQVHPRQLGQRLVRPPGHGNAQAAGQDRSGARAVQGRRGGHHGPAGRSRDGVVP